MDPKILATLRDLHAAAIAHVRRYGAVLKLPNGTQMQSPFVTIANNYAIIINRARRNK